MSSHSARILLVADTHLGFDLPFRPRVQRRRRGHDFFANLEIALEPALAGKVDLVVHGGDLYYRSRVPPALVDMAMAPLLKVARSGTPVYIVPGNHERSRIPLNLWTTHPNLHIFDQPRTFHWPGPGGSLALSGFPFERQVRGQFGELVKQTNHHQWPDVPKLLCIHQAVEGSQVGVHNYTFRDGADVIRGSDIPRAFSAVLSGHIHRAQTLTHDLRGEPLGAPVIYPGSVERTSFAERGEPKGYVIAEVGLAGDQRGQLIGHDFVPLPARPMAIIVLEATDPDPRRWTRELKARLDALEPDSVVRVEVKGPCAGQAVQALNAAALREMAPDSMNVALAGQWSSRLSK
jgi:DNA repair exonuclease SbcCD nuclease subunit